MRINASTRTYTQFYMTSYMVQWIMPQQLQHGRQQRKLLNQHHERNRKPRDNNFLYKLTHIRTYVYLCLYVCVWAGAHYRHTDSLPGARVVVVVWERGIWTTTANTYIHTDMQMYIHRPSYTHTHIYKRMSCNMFCVEPVAQSTLHLQHSLIWCAPTIWEYTLPLRNYSICRCCITAASSSKPFICLVFFFFFCANSPHNGRQ